MNPAAPKDRELTPEEISTIVDWIDGNLSPQAAGEFEMRLSADSELARQVEAFAGLDAMVRREARTRGKGSRSSLRKVAWIALAAAAVIVIGLVPRFFAPEAPRCEVALAPGFALAEDWTQQDPELAGASAPGIAVTRGENSAQLTTDEFLRRTERAEAAVVQGALESKRTQLEAGWFVIPIELSAPASVVVLGFAQNAPALRLFPIAKGADGADPSQAAQRLGAGRQLLPSARAVEGRTPQTLDYRPGFLVPVGAKELVVLVGVRAAGMDAAALAELDGWLGSERSAERALGRLEKSGFAVQRLSVREPQ